MRFMIIGYNQNVKRRSRLCGSPGGGSEMDAVHIVAAKRTPIGKLNGAFASLSAAELGGQLIRQCLPIPSSRPTPSAR
jgi:hypothetical protein